MYNVVKIINCSRSNSLRWQRLLREIQKYYTDWIFTDEWTKECREHERKHAKEACSSVHRLYGINSRLNHKGFSGKMPGNVCGEKCDALLSLGFLVRDGNLRGMWLLPLHKATEIVIIRNYVWALGWQPAGKEEKTRLELSNLRI